MTNTYNKISKFLQIEHLNEKHKANKNSKYKKHKRYEYINDSNITLSQTPKN